MSKMKTFLLTAAMAVGLTACASNNNEDAASGAMANDSSTQTTEQAEGTLKIAGLDGGYGTAGWEAVIKKFEEDKGVKVEYQFEKNISEVVRPEIQAGNSPDIMYLSIGAADSLTSTMLKEKMVMDITDVLDMQVPGEDVKVGDKIMPGFADTSITNPYGDGKTYLAPLFYSPAGLWYNKAMFKDGGGKYDLPETMEDFLKLGEEAKKDGKSLFTYPVAGYLDSFTFALAAEVGGNELLDKLVNYDPEAWEKEATPVFETIGEIVQNYLNPNTVSQANKESFTQNQLSVMKDETLFMPNGTWIVEEMKDAQGVVDNFDWGFMALPSYNGSDRYAYSFFEQAFIPKDAKNPELAKEFLAYLYSDEAAKLFAENKGGIQPIEGFEQFLQDDQSKLFYSIFEGENGAKAAIGGWAAAPTVEGVDMHAELFDSVNSVANGDKTVEDWQKGVVETVTKIHDAIESEK